MLETKDNNLSTYESRRNTEVFGSRFKGQLRYDINDYLPPQDGKFVGQLFSFANYEIGNGNYSRESRESRESQGHFDSKREQQLCLLKLQMSQKEKVYDEKLAQLTTELDQLTQQYKKLQEQIKISSQKTKSDENTIARLTKQKEQLETELNLITKKSQDKSKNIRIFCQKYEVAFEPKPKHSYTIQVQTEAEQVRNEPIASLVLPEIGRSKAKSSVQVEFPSNRKVSTPGNPQFYQLYQQQFQPQLHLDLHSQPTSRCQILPPSSSSAQKPKRPALLDTPFENPNKQNNRNRLNQLLEIKPQQPKAQPPVKIKNQEIQIYPVDADMVQDIVAGILAYK